MTRPTTAVLCLARNEHPFLHEWLDYHLGLGFDRIHLISTDDDLAPLRSELDASRFCPNLEVYHSEDFAPGWQTRTYNEFLSSVDEDWIVIIDLDEYLYLNGYPDVQAFVGSVPDHVGQVQFPWLNVFSDHYAHRRTFDILEDARLHPSDHVKSMARRTDVRGLGIHSHAVGGADTMLASGLTLRAHHSHAHLLREPEYFDAHPFVIHFCSRGHLDLLNRISAHLFFNAKSGEGERNRTRRMLEAEVHEVHWRDLPNRYLLIEFYRSLPTVDIDIRLPHLEAETNLDLLQDLFGTVIQKTIDFPIDPSRPIAEAFEARYQLSRKLAAVRTTGLFEIDDYLACGSQLEYVDRVRRSER